MCKLSILLSCLIIALHVAANDTIIGIWENSTGKAHIEIYKMNNKYYGKIVRLLQPTYANGSPKVDKNNPDKSLQAQPIIGLIVLKDLVYNSDDDLWNNGNIYNPNDGRCYKCFIKLKDSNTLDVRGYIGCALLGKTESMHRVR